MATIHSNNKVLILIGSPGKIGAAEPSLPAQLRKVLGFSCDNAREWSKRAVVLKFVFIRDDNPGPS
jgi:hypothetical protein